MRSCTCSSVGEYGTRRATTDPLTCSFPTRNRGTSRRRSRANTEFSSAFRVGDAGCFPPAPHGPAPKAIAEKYVGELDHIYPGIAKLYTGVAYLDVWAHDPWHHGAYSYYGVGQYTKFAGIEPKPERNVFFAGEQTSYNDMGYINGAVISGERAAREIARTDSSW